MDSAALDVGQEENNDHCVFVNWAAAIIQLFLNAGHQAAIVIKPAQEGLSAAGEQGRQVVAPRGPVK